MSPGTTAEPPPIAMLLPLLQSVLAGLTLLFGLGVRLLFAMVYPLRIIWYILYVLLSPLTVVIKISLDLVLFTPFSIIHKLAVAFYPVYVFCAAACIFGATVGLFGNYVSTTILNSISRTKYFTQPPSPPPQLAPQVALRKRKRKSSTITVEDLVYARKWRDELFS
ncbi:hypothetical protein JVU11DRAFT_11646 [Chiua virens]|nr:hypothetical protein JVU11DRAFT_11646 [Chiua virens]